MAEPTAALVSAAKPSITGGVINAAPLGTTLPEDVATALAAEFVKLGYISADGLTNSIEVDTEDVKAFGGDVVLTSQTSRKETFKVTMLQSLDKEVLAEVYGAGNVTVATGENGVMKVRHNGKARDHRVWVFEMLLTGGKVKRIVVPDGQISEIGEVVYSDGDPIGYEATITAFPFKDWQGDTAREFIGSLA